MAASTIFGVLSGLADFGQQKGEASQIANQELMERLAAQQQSAQFRSQEQTAKLNRQRLQQLLTTGAQPQPFGQPYISNGKMVQPYKDPLSGQISYRETTGPLPETPEQALMRGFQAVFPNDPDRAGKLFENVYSPTRTRAPVHKPMPDASSPTGTSDVYYNPDPPYEEMFRIPAYAPVGQTGRVRNTDTTDPLTGLTIHSHSVTEPLRPGGAGGFIQPPATPQATTPAATPQTPAAAAGSAPGTALPTPTATGAGTPAPIPGGITAGPFRGLDAQGHIPARPGLNPYVLEAANQILDGADINKIPQRMRYPAANLAKIFGWKGQGSLTPAQQMQVEQVDNALAALSTPQNLALFDKKASIPMAYLSLDPQGEGGFQGVANAVERKIIPQEYATYLNELTRLRGVITGIRTFTGANNSNATADRLLAELPTFANTKNGKDAADKLLRLRQELSIIKRLGFFLDDASAAAIKMPSPSTAAPTADNPMGLDLSGKP